MAVKTILSKQEVIEYAEYRDTFPATAIKLIADVERFEATQRLGFDFYTLLLNNLTDVSAAVKYQSGTYNTNQIVIYNNRYYTCLRNDVTSQPPTVNDWKETPKFQNSCYQTLYCDYLARYLSLCVIQKQMPTALLQMAAGSLVQPISGDYNTPSKAAIDTELRGIEQLREIAFQNMDAYLKREYASTAENSCKTAFEKYKNLAINTTSSDCGCDLCGTKTVTKKSTWY